MPSTKFTATDPNGTVHTRTSKNRIYTHTVVYQRSKAAAIESAKAMHKQHLETGRYLLDCIANGKHLSLMKFGHYANDAGRHARDVEDAKRSLRGLTTPEGYAAWMVADALEKIEASDWSQYWNAGWCGRLELAQKLAASTNGVILVAKVS